MDGYIDRKKEINTFLTYYNKHIMHSYVLLKDVKSWRLRETMFEVIAKLGVHFVNNFSNNN